jgi:hypothetical protein
MQVGAGQNAPMSGFERDARLSTSPAPRKAVLSEVDSGVSTALVMVGTAATMIFIPYSVSMSAVPTVL